MLMSYTLDEFKDGVVLPINKPLEWTSLDVVARMRNQICRKHRIKKLKVGHAGTLDPLATGVLVVCIGKATKRIVEITDTHKEYIAEITFGATTPSFDLETEPDQTFPTEHITPELIGQALKQHFSGIIQQRPPLYSAKWVGGKRAYELARQGVKHELPLSQVEILETEILSYQAPVLLLRVACSKGTYIRTLAHEIGQAVDSGAHLSGLCRTKVGQFTLNDAIELADFEKHLTTT